MENGGLCSKNVGAMTKLLPSFLGEETLYSWVARYHLRSGNVLAKHSSLELFSDQYAGLRPDFQFHLDDFCVNTCGLLGNSASLIYKRTLFGYFAPFQDDASIQEVLLQMQGGASSRLKSMLGLLASRVGATHPLKGCPKCVAEELRKYGVAFWHVEHQWPSVWACRSHGMLLQALCRRLQPKSLRRLILPDEVHARDWERPKLKPSLLPKLISIAQFSHDITRWPECNLNSEVLRITYLLGAQSHGLMSTDGSIRFKIFRHSFLSHHKGLECLPGFESIAGAQREHGGLLGVLTRRYEGKRHPLKHYLLMSFLFPSAKEFFDAYSQAKEMTKSLDDDGQAVRLNQDWKIKLRSLIESEKLSVSEAARKLAVPLPQAIRFAKENGVQYQKKPHVLNAQLEKSLYELIHKGLSQISIAETLGVKKSFVRSYLAKNRELRNQWRIATSNSL